MADWLASRGLKAEAYTSQTDGERREELETALLENRVKALVATSALGMGFDKPDIGFVIHYQAPGSAVTYYQQVGRAGRALRAAWGVLLSGTEETGIADYFIDSAFPTEAEVAQVIEALEAAEDGLSLPALEGKINVPRGRIDKTLQLLSLESPAPVAKQGSRWQLTAATLSDGFRARAKRLTALRREEQCQMQEYVRLESGHMAFLVRALDGDASAVRSPDLPRLPAAVAPDVVREAAAFLRRADLPILPRKRWPTGGMPEYRVSGQIPERLRAQAGKALCVWDNAGWGGHVSRGKYRDRRFDDELVRACVASIRRWAPRPAPEWVTCIPSRRRPTLVPDFAERLSAALGLPFHAALANAAERPEQKTMKNGVQQARNVDGAFAVSLARLPSGPLFLVDDMVDSRWTLTVAAWLLRSHGAGPVWPVALAEGRRAR